MLNKFLITVLLGTVFMANLHYVYAQPSRVIITNDGPKSGLTNSPLSRIGIGNLQDPSNTMIKGMGGIGTAYNNPFAINKLNPATYAFIKATTFDVSALAYSNNILLNNNNLKSNSYSINSLAFAFPISKNWGLSFGYHPKSTVYYDAHQQDVIAGLDTVNRMYYGYGSMHNLHLGTGFKYKGFSLGVNANYIFGSILNSSAIESIYLINPGYTNAEFYTVNRNRGFQFQIGGLYQHVFKEKYYLHIGATYEAKARLNSYTDNIAMQYSYLMNTAGTIVPAFIDTIASLTYRNQKGNLQLPSDFSFGVHVGKSAYWNIGIDFKTTQWSDYSFRGNRDNIANSTYRVALGGEVTPNPEASKNVFLNNIVYRFGGYYGTDYAVYENQLTYYGSTFSVGLPLFNQYGSRGRGLVNFALDLGKTSNGSPVSAPKYSNNYFKFTLGFNFNDFWFQKRPFE